MLEIRYAGIELLGHPRDMSRPYGLFVGRGGFQGWGGMSTRRREALARAAVHGEHDTRVLLGSRIVTVDGFALARSDEELEVLVDRFGGVGADGDRNPFEVALLGLRRTWARTLIATHDEFGREHGLRKSEIQLQVVCADPRKYGATTTIPAAGMGTVIPVTHDGNFPAAPLVEIPSAPATYTITSPMGTYTVAGATAGGTHRVDMGTGRVTRNNVLMKGVGRGPLWAVPAQQTWTHTLSVPGRVLITNTYI